MAYPNYMDYLTSIARGPENGELFVHKFGHSHNVTTTAYPVWTKGGPYTYLAVGVYLMIASDIATDNSAGIGARTARLEGLDEYYDIVTEDVSLNGFTGVTTTSKFIRIFRTKVLTAGTSEYNIGRLEIIPDIAANTFTAAGVPTSTSNILVRVDSTTCQTLMAIYTIPNGYKGYLQNTYMSCPEAKLVSGEMYRRDFGSVFQVKEQIDVYRQRSDSFHAIPVPIDAKTDIEFRAVSSASSADVSAGFDLLLCKGD